ncbi:membrane progestin receptor alpha-B [Patella vulgata]|uniref:membrane progestin receptor alpha-B n=1 Tax=Patella vulgata TaxID=6465 RepID=UPI00217F6A1F|nr:membrane progestin receptor alpha-B [Patella vulgata]XP_050403764.1 membrane progestin receptor alpha-B [Patella vulgata]
MDKYMKHKLPTWLQPVFKSQRTQTVEQVPAPMKELYIRSGFRVMNQPWSYYLLSLFNWHNETLNVWTHLVSFVVIWNYTDHLGETFDLKGSSAGAVILGYSIGALLLTLLSSVAHLFHAKSLKHHYLFFALDYIGVSLYCFGCGILTHYVFSPSETFLVLRNTYIPVHFFLCFNSFLSCTVAKLYFHGNKRKMIMVSGCFAHTLWLLIPIFARYYYCIVDTSCSVLSLNHLVAMYICLMATSVAYVAHQPEKSNPGAFDIIGHSHQIFHIFVFFTILAQFNAMTYELGMTKSVNEDLTVNHVYTVHIILIVMEITAVIFLLPQLNKKVKDIESCASVKQN